MIVAKEARLGDYGRGDGGESAGPESGGSVPPA
jgi:hypothetical protein